jgi:DNA-binding CsgD family transcriptional regulator
MRIIQKSILQLRGAEYYVYHLSIINPFLPVALSPREIEVLGTFMSFKGELAEKDRFGTTFRKEVKKMLSMSAAGLSNHINSLKSKGAIKENLQGYLEIIDILLPEDKQQNYQFKIVKENEITAF